jgi:hypothetical protein
MLRAFPSDGAPTFQLRRITGGGDVWTVEAVGNYGGETYFVICIFEFRDGKIVRETRYYPQAFDPPEWRAQWVERSRRADPVRRLSPRRSTWAQPSR